MLKDEDRRILRYLQSDPSLNPSELAERCRISPQSVTRRLARLEELGILQGVTARIDWQKLGYSVEVSLRFTLDKHRRVPLTSFWTPRALCRRFWRSRPFWAASMCACQ